MSKPNPEEILRLKIRTDDQYAIATVWVAGEPMTEIARILKQSVGGKSDPVYMQWVESVNAIFQRMADRVVSNIEKKTGEKVSILTGGSTDADYAGESEEEQQMRFKEDTLEQLTNCYEANEQRVEQGEEVKAGPQHLRWDGLLSGIVHGIECGWVEAAALGPTTDEEGKRIPYINWSPTDSGVRAMKAYARRATNKRKPDILRSVEEGPDTSPDSDRPAPF